MRRILVVRHGESLWNRERRWQGWIDIALTDIGEVQARARGAELRAAGLRFGAVHSSDLVRAARTAELLAEELGLARPTTTADLRERFGGHWQGLTRDEMTARWPAEREAWRRGELAAPPGGETDDEVIARVDAALVRINAASDEGPILVVTHHGVVRLLSTRAGIAPSELIPNLGGRWFDLDDSVLRPLDALAPLPIAEDSGTE